MEHAAKRPKVELGTVQISIGGTCFESTADTLINGSSYFGALLSGNFREHKSGESAVDHLRCAG